MTNPIKVAIFGAGRWGTHLIRNFYQHPQAQVVAIADPHFERLQKAKERLLLDDTVKLETDWFKVINDCELDAVVIATPASTHYTLIYEALERGYHVFAEKPLTLKLSESQSLCSLAKRHNRQLFIDHTYLFHPAVTKGQAVIEQGQLGQLRYGYAARTHLEPVRQDVDALWDLAIHDIGIFNTWLGQKPVEVQATGTVWLQPDRSFDLSSPSFPISNNISGLSDVVMATITYESGFQAFLHLCWLNPDKQRRLALVGSEGTLIFDEMLKDRPLTLQRGYLETVGEGWQAAGVECETVEVEPAEPLAQVCDRFLNCIRHNQVCSISSGEIGTDLVRVLCGLSESLQQGGKPIQL
ncbi:Gfo/Idh/MocA family oxidoreductase [Limnoraphis robusta Tam1]|uniref:Gfo/Idh/MocA family protein n=1 Tax=Limnoraphis robusta TaxID=1118279 RepID=UPI002B20EF14|nr:Gfo/Idh/MocA family oxidoreductase [Limnoraphis robusta]MEA5538356.1 Gfo/Idh/MocA family oxidoreductase [Limnoraphis robusta Tam1]